MLVCLQGGTSGKSVMTEHDSAFMRTIVRDVKNAVLMCVMEGDVQVCGGCWR